MSGTAPYYRQAFWPLPDRCFRLVSGGEGGGPTHCPEPPTLCGPFRAPSGRRYRVEASRAGLEWRRSATWSSSLPPSP
jgi:hypothetical protein